MLLRAVAALPDGTVRRCRVAALASQLAVYAQGPRIAAALRCTRLSRATMARPISS